jgi:hypothetical protein
LIRSASSFSIGSLKFVQKSLRGKSWGPSHGSPRAAQWDLQTIERSSPLLGTVPDFPLADVQNYCRAKPAPRGQSTYTRFTRAWMAHRKPLEILPARPRSAARRSKQVLRSLTASHLQFGTGQKSGNVPSGTGFVPLDGVRVHPGVAFGFTGIPILLQLGLFLECRRLVYAEDTALLVPRIVGVIGEEECRTGLSEIGKCSV